MSTKTILFVEDQLDFRAIHTLNLERHGFLVLTAGDGEEGVQIAAERVPDLILMDGGLPRVDGLEAIRRLKKNSATRDIPVLLLTAMSFGAVGQRARAAGCDGVLQKPIEPKRVLQEVLDRIGPPNRPVERA